MATKDDIIAAIKAVADATGLPRVRLGLGEIGEYVMLAGERLRTGQLWEPNKNDEGPSPTVVQIEGLADYLDSAPPLPHAPTHENGGTDEISVAGLSGALADPQVPAAHAAAHENGGGDEISVAGLSGALGDRQDADQLQGRDVQDAAPNDGDVLTWDDGDTRWEPQAPLGGAGLFDDMAVFIHTEASGTDGDSLTGGGTWNIRSLNSVRRASASGDIAVNTGTGVVTLKGGKKYFVEARIVSYRVAFSQSRLYNITDAAVAILGRSERNSFNYYGHGDGAVIGEVDLSAVGDKTFQFETACTDTRTYGGGEASSFSAEVYSIVTIYRLS